MWFFVALLACRTNHQSVIAGDTADVFTSSESAPVPACPPSHAAKLDLHKRFVGARLSLLSYVVFEGDATGAFEVRDFPPDSQARIGVLLGAIDPQPLGAPFYFGWQSVRLHAGDKSPEVAPHVTSRGSSVALMGLPKGTRVTLSLVQMLRAKDPMTEPLWQIKETRVCTISSSQGEWAVSWNGCKMIP